MAEKDLGKSSTGIQPNIAALLSYLFGWITGLIFFLIEKENKFVRFHALQSLIIFAFLNIIVMVPVIGWMLAPIIGVLAVVLWIILMIKAYQGEKFKLPVVGDIAEKKA